MWSEIGTALGTMLGWILTAVFGVAGWLAASFLGKPFLDFLALRGQVHEEMVYRANVGPMVGYDKEKFDEAIEVLRRLGAKMHAMNISATPQLRWFFKYSKFDVATAAGNLIGLSNALSPLETTYDDRIPHINKIQIALRLPRTYTDGDVKHARERKLDNSSIKTAQQLDSQRRNQR
jgi:hypothetical protein